jgi:hypothetical protein
MGINLAVMVEGVPDAGGEGAVEAHRDGREKGGDRVEVGDGGTECRVDGSSVELLGAEVCLGGVLREVAGEVARIGLGEAVVQAGLV